MSDTENKATPLTIEQVENGFIVTNSFHEEMRYPKRFLNGDGRASYEAATPRVFRSMAELIEFLGGHFTHRAKSVLEDPLTE